jgi:hypothetical protein
MGSDGRLRYRHHRSGLTMRPPVAVDENDSHPLLPTQSTQRGGEARFDPRLGTDDWNSVRAWTEARPGLALTDPVQVADRCLHLTHPIPVLPAIRQSLRGGITTTIRAVRRHHRDTKLWLVELHELGELILRRSSHSVTPARSVLSCSTTTEHRQTVTTTIRSLQTSTAHNRQYVRLAAAFAG